MTGGNLKAGGLTPTFESLLRASNLVAETGANKLEPGCTAEVSAKI